MKLEIAPGTKPILGHLSEFRKDPLAFIQKYRAEYGTIVRLKLLRRNVYLVSDPELIHEVLVVQAKNFKKSRALQLARDLLGDGLLTSEGELHLKQRRMMAPAFHRKKIFDYARMMGEDARKFRLSLKENTLIDLHTAMMELTLSIVARTLFDADVTGDAKNVGDALHAALSMFQRVTNPFAQILRRLPTPGTLRFRAARKQLFAIIDRIIEEHRGKDHGDLLSMLLDARDEEDQSSMSHEQIRHEALTLFLAGHETTANALTWAFYLLAKNPAASDRLQKEVQQQTKHLALDEPIPPELAQNFPYCRNVFAEAMRLYPPAWIIGREALNDFTLGKYSIAAKSVIVMSQFVVHRDKQWFDDPLTFKPERWEGENDRPRFAYFPFGGGPRTCIGDQFAWMEGTLLLAEISRQFRFVPLGDAIPQPQITLRPRGGMMARVVRTER
ncbi:MAG: cytochrome P450 [Leptospirales bacterium]|nr:cytochrome P450 [Leptospirales bacterium]